MHLPTAFWSNTVWYILLGIISIISIVFILYKSNNRNFDIGFGLAVLGATFHAEFTLLVAFNAYRYFPTIFNDSFLDSVIGNYVSQTSVASTVGLIIVYRMPAIWNYIVSGMYFLIDILFVNLGIYLHLWYKSWYTLMLVFLSLLIANKWYHYLLNYPNSFIYYLTLHLGARALIFTYNCFQIFIFD